MWTRKTGGKLPSDLTLSTVLSRRQFHFSPDIVHGSFYEILIVVICDREHHNSQLSLSLLACLDYVTACPFGNHASKGNINQLACQVFKDAQYFVGLLIFNVLHPWI